MADAGSLAPVDEIYAERNAVALAFANLAVLYGWVVGYTAADPEWPVLFIDTPHGQVSWHLKADELPDDFPPYIGEWDGHTNEEKHRRLRAFVEHGNKTSRQDGDEPDRITEYANALQEIAKIAVEVQPRNPLATDDPHDKALSRILNVIGFVNPAL